MIPPLDQLVGIFGKRRKKRHGAGSLDVTSARSFSIVCHMKRKASIIASLSAALVFAIAGEAAGQSDAPAQKSRYTIHVLTMGPDEPLFTRFGHIALLVEDRVDRTKKVYNYGTFDFADPNLQARYVRGFLTYWLSVSHYADTVRRYGFEDRRLVDRALNLSPEQASSIAAKLELNARPENREYAYRHYIDNCCTRIRDIIDAEVGGALSAGRDKKPTGRTFRDWTRDALEGLPLSRAAILFSLGPAVDRPLTRFDEQFLPAVLGEDLDETRLPDGRPLVKQKRVIFERKGPEVGHSADPLELAVVISLLAALGLGLLLPIALGARRGARRLLGFGLIVWGALAGLGGVILTLFWTVTTHYDTYFNENLLVMPPIHLWLVVPGAALLFRGRLSVRWAKAVARYALVALALIALGELAKLGPFIQQNWEFIGLASACNLAVILGLRSTQVSRDAQQPRVARSISPSKGNKKRKKGGNGRMN